MGQTTQAIFYGVREAEGAWPVDEDGEMAALRPWTKVNAKAIEARRAALGAAIRSGEVRPYEVDADGEFVPERVYGTACFVGFFVACGASGRPNAVALDEPVALDEIATTEPYAGAYRRAVARWDAFAAWAQSTGLTLPPARLWLCETEVA